MFKDVGYKLMGAAFEVYNELGYGLAEELYQQSLEVELGLRNMSFLTKHELAVYYKGHRLDTVYKPDLFVLDCLVVELKAVTELAEEHEAQLFNYLRISRQPIGYLINFGHKNTLEWKRFILSDLHKRTDPTTSPEVQISEDQRRLVKISVPKLSHSAASETQMISWSLRA
jgi:GxxExxY protein